MSTTGIESWALDLKDVGAIYPFQGSEGWLVLIGLVTWIGWHVWCLRWEKKQHAEKVRQYGDHESLRKALDSN